MFTIETPLDRVKGIYAFDNCVDPTLTVCTRAQHCVGHTMERVWTNCHERSEPASAGNLTPRIQA